MIFPIDSETNIITKNSNTSTNDTKYLKSIFYERLQICVNLKKFLNNLKGFMISFELTCFSQIYASKVTFIAKRNVKVWDECVSLGTPIWLFN